MILSQSIFTSEGFLVATTSNEAIELLELTRKIVGSKQVDPKGIELIKHFESAHDGDKKKPGLQPQMDPVGIWTVGYGLALRHTNGNFMRGNKDRAAAYAHRYANLTEAQATDLLKELVATEYMPLVHKFVDVGRLKPHQLAALCSFAYNCGTHYRNKAGKRVPFAIWKNCTTMKVGDLKSYWESSVIRAGGKVLPGLMRRRKAEYHLFATGTNKFNF